MHTKSFKTIITAIAVTLVLAGIQWYNTPAQALPTGAHTGSNPFFSWAGQVNNGATVTAGSAPSHSDIVITDIILTTASFCGSDGYDITLTTSAGTDIGKFRLSAGYANNSSHHVSNVIASLRSGLVLPAGENLQVSSSTGYQTCRTDYTLSGYHAK